jgi:hypothetical protein
MIDVSDEDLERREDDWRTTFGQVGVFESTNRRRDCDEVTFSFGSMLYIASR